MYLGAPAAAALPRLGDGGGTRTARIGSRPAKHNAPQIVLSLDEVTAVSGSGADATGRRLFNGTAAAMPAGPPSRLHSGGAGWFDIRMTPLIYEYFRR